MTQSSFKSCQTPALGSSQYFYRGSSQHFYRGSIAKDSSSRKTHLHSSVDHTPISEQENLPGYRFCPQVADSTSQNTPPVPDPVIIPTCNNLQQTQEATATPCNPLPSPSPPITVPSTPPPRLTPLVRLQLDNVLEQYADAFDGLGQLAHLFTSRLMKTFNPC